MKISLIIPTSKKQFGKELSELLHSLKISLQENTLDFEISTTVVFNGSGGGDFECPSGLTVRRVQEDLEGLVFARHRGVIENWDADYFVFLDDDVLLETSYVAGLSELARHSPQLATGALKPIWECTPPNWITEKYFSASPWPNLPYLSIMAPPPETLSVDPMYVWGANFIAAKRTLQDAEGFHPDGFPTSKYILRGDGETHIAEIVKTAGHQAHYSNKLAVRHRVPKARLNLDYFIRRMLMEGVSTSYRHVRQNVGTHLPENITNLASVDFETLVTLTKPANTFEEIEDMTSLESRCRTLGYYWHQLASRMNPLITQWCRKTDYLFTSSNLIQELTKPVKH